MESHVWYIMQICIKQEKNRIAKRFIYAKETINTVIYSLLSHMTLKIYGLGSIWVNFLIMLSDVSVP